MATLFFKVYNNNIIILKTWYLSLKHILMVIIITGIIELCYPSSCVIVKYILFITL